MSRKYTGVIPTAEEFWRLRQSENPEEYNRSAHSELALEAWQQLLKESADVRYWATQNKTVPLWVLEHLASDDDDRVRNMVASKRKLSEQLQLFMCADSNEGVRMSLACNAKATRKVLERLLADTWEEVAEKAQTLLDEGQCIDT